MSHDPEAGRKLRAAVEGSAAEQLTGQKLSNLEAVLHCFVPDEESQAEVRALLIDLVFRYVLAAGRMHFAAGPEGEADERLDRFLTRYTRLTGETRTNFRRKLKQAILTATAERPKSERRDRILSKQQKYFCYLCGEPVREGDEQLDHVWPQNAGGGTSGGNLLKTHTACQVLKHDLAVPGDAAMGRFAYHGRPPRQLAEKAIPHWGGPLPDEAGFTQLLDDVRASGLRVALLLQQGGMCHRCGKEFRSAGPTRLVRLEEDLPWWPPNTVLCCVSCVGG